MKRTRFWIGIVLVVFLAGLGLGVHAQQRRSPDPSSPRDEGTTTTPSTPSPSRKMLKESFEQMQKDVAQLYDLASELKEETEKADVEELSLAVMKKAEAIEKLAEKIKNRMKNL